MTNTEKIEQKAQELTDYCFARGMTVSKLTFNHFIESIDQALAEDRKRVRGEIEKRIQEAKEILEKSPTNFSAMGALVVLNDLLASLDINLK